MSGAVAESTLRVYWQPGCTGCLRTKEFLRSHGVDFHSVNVLTEDGLAEFTKLAARQLPVVARGDVWVNGLDLLGVARLAGFRYGRTPQLPPAELAQRISKVLGTTLSLLRQIPERNLKDKLPARPRTYRELGGHIFQIVRIFLDKIENDRPVMWEDYNEDLPLTVVSSVDLFALGSAIGERFDAWWRHQDADFTQEVMIYYGPRSLHDFLERTTWHATQHARQLQLVVETLDITPRLRIEDADLAGLPLPNHVWDDEFKFALPATTASS
jgi:glutaredoxin